MRRLLAIFAVLAALSTALDAAPTARQLSFVGDSLYIHLKDRTGVDEPFRLSSVRSRSGSLDLYFTSGLAFYPWREADLRWSRSYVQELLRSYDGSLQLGRIFSSRYEISELVLPEVGNSGRPHNYDRAIDDPRLEDEVSLVRRLDVPAAPDGLDGRHIALWQSHGRYYDAESDSWIWQRAPLHGTVEDMLTPGFVIPYLIPMLENAGAYVMTPRERDWSEMEIICDNDPSFAGPRDALTRIEGRYSESGEWQDAGEGFADFKRIYNFSDNPFKAGSARKAACSPEGGSSANWSADIPERGVYAVYVSYKTLPESSERALYTVTHMGGESRFSVDQRRGGGTWIYLGSFEFDRGSGVCVRLENSGEEGTWVSADAVKIGGGMGKLERGGSTSGVSSAMEGAHYWMQWAGVDSSITRNWKDNDYTNDFATRGLWTTMMREEKQIPFDLSLAFHTDAGLTPNDSIVGTLAIYTLRNESDREFSDGRDRIISRLLCDYVQTQVVRDIRANHDTLWARRGLWDKSYSESRTTGVPAMILELLSHQNFSDMRHALDPAFRFTACRAVYKGILKTLSEYYGCPYVVQPLPVRALSATIDDDGTARLSWEPRTDSLEPTAISSSYIVYTRIDDGAFDNGRVCSRPYFEMPTQAGHIYSFKVEACNSGGRSFPSEVMSVGRPSAGSKGKVLVVNNFTKVSAPGSMDVGDIAGFSTGFSSALPYIRDISYIGEPYEYRRASAFIDNTYPGFGASYDNRAGSIIAGNTFDYCSEHGRLLLALGYSFASMSAEAFRNYGTAGSIDGASTGSYVLLDLVCGKQGGEKYPVFPSDMKDRLREFCNSGGQLLVSGSNIASDNAAADAAFLASVLGIRLASPSGTDLGMLGDMPFSSTLNPDIYCVEHPDALRASGRESTVWLKYPRSTMAGAIRSDKGRYRAVSIAVPIESLIHPEDRMKLMRESLEFLIPQ